MKNSKFEAKETRIAGGGMLRPLADSLLLLLTLVFIVSAKQIVVSGDANSFKGILPILAASFLCFIWISLIRWGKLHVLKINGSQLVYINWYGRTEKCSIEELERIEVLGAYVCFWRNGQQLFAKFNKLTKGLEMVQLQAKK